MDAYISRAINEHKELSARINKLGSFITACDVDRVKGDSKVDVEDYVLMRIQLEHMLNYHNVLEARLNKHGIIVDGGKYFEDVTEICDIRVPENSNPAPGSDFDLDKEKAHGIPEN